MKAIDSNYEVSIVTEISRTTYRDGAPVAYLTPTSTVTPLKFQIYTV